MNLKYNIICLGALLLSGQGQGRTDSGSPAIETCQGNENRDAVALVLSNHETLPPAHAVQASDAPLLKDIVLSSCYPSFTRARGLRMLAKIQGQAAAGFVEAVLEDNTKSFYLRIEAAHVLKNILEKSSPDRVAAKMALLLKSRDARLRSTGLYILSDLGTPLALTMIRDHGLVERNVDILDLYYSK